MPSFSKAIAFLTAFAVTSSITTITTVDAACECIGVHQPETSKFFEDQGYPSDQGATCHPGWSVLYPDDVNCAEGGTDYGADWCIQPWCYVAADNTCDPPALDTAKYVDTIYEPIMSDASSISAYER